MLSGRVRIAVLGLGILLVAVVAGCSTPTTRITTTDGASTMTTAGGTADAVETSVPTTTVSPRSISNASATERALAAEEASLEAVFRNASCVESWGTDATVGIDREATVVNRTADGVYVEVTHPYWYGTDDTEADDGSHALYLVTPETVHRVRGDDVSPCGDRTVDQ